MRKELKVLNVEDSLQDAALLQRHLERADYSLVFQRVDTAETMRAALAEQTWDVVLSDYSMPQFDTFAALRILQESGQEIPFIVISGTIGEETAVKSMLAGAHDYLMKGHLARLVPAIERELQEAENRRARRQAEAALRASEAEMRALFMAMKDMIFVLNAEGFVLKIAPTDQSLLYKPAEEQVGHYLHEIFVADTAELFLSQIRRALQEGSLQRLEYDLLVNGKTLWFEGRILPMTDDTVIWIAHDITDRKQAAVALRESKERFQALFEDSADGKMIFDPTGLVVDCNKVAIEMLGYTKEELLKLTIFDLELNLTPSQLEQINQTIIQQERMQYETRYRVKGGELRDMLVVSTKINLEGADYGYASLVDLTERKRAESALNQERARLETIAHASPSVIISFRATPEGEASYPYASPAFYEIYGLTPEQVREDSRVTDPYAHPDDFPHLVESIRESARTMSPWHFVWRVNNPQKGEIWVEGYATPVRETDGSCTWHGILNDVTERKRQEVELQKSQERLTLALTIAKMSVWEWDVNSNHIFFSPDHDETLLVGNVNETLDGLLEFVHPEDQPRVTQAIEQAMTNKESASMQFRVLRPDGKEFWLSTFGRAQFDEQGQPTRLIGIAMDITEMKRADEELARSLEQVRSLSLHLQLVREEERRRIAREIHDELGQALIGLKYDLARLESGLKSGDAEALQICREKVQSMSEQVNSTIQIGRKIATELRPSVLDDLGLVAALEWQAREFQTRTGIKCDFAANAEMLDLETNLSTALFRIFQETLTNVARHAKANLVWIRLHAQHTNLRLEVRDNGRGITDAEMMQSGSLGLLGMRERVLHFGGQVEVKGQPGNGTTVMVSIPLEIAT